MKRALPIIIAALLAGCMPHRGAGGSVDGLSGHGDVQAFAAQAASELQERQPPGQTTLALRKVPGQFGDALESELRGRGFALVQADVPEQDALEVSYAADVLEDRGFVQLRCADDAFSFSRPLGSPARPSGHTEPPSGEAARDNSVQSRPLPEPEAKAESLATAPVAREPAATPSTVPVKSTATALKVARRNGIAPADFCRWNQVGASAVLEKGYPVYLSEPPAGASPVAAPVPVPPGVEAMMAAETVTTTTAASTPPPVSLPANTSARLSLGSNAPARQAVYEPAPQKAPDNLQNEPVASVAAPTPVPAVLETENMAIETLAPALPVWEIAQGRMLRAQMKDWADQAGYTLIWNAQNDYELKSSASFPGVFVEAVRDCFSALQANGLALRVTIYQGNNVMEVAEQ